MNSPEPIVAPEPVLWSATPARPLSAVPALEEPSTSDPESRDIDGEDRAKPRKEKKTDFAVADPWQRYRALVDSLKEAQDLVDLADHKARFALIIMGGLNAAILILGTRSELVSRLPAEGQPWLYLYFALYAMIAVYFFVQAIESLRPRAESLTAKPWLGAAGSAAEGVEIKSLGLRFFSDALRYDLNGYLNAWQNVRVGDLNAELATQLYTLARINRAKYAAVRRLYSGLQAVTLLTWGFLVAMAVFAWVEQEVLSLTGKNSTVAAALPPEKSGVVKRAEEGWNILGEPERITVPGLKEPSGIVFSPRRGSFFIVSDRGTLVEIDPSGRQVGAFTIGGDLEDVALHTPSGRLVLLSERRGELVVFDPTAGVTTGRFKIDAEGLLGATRARRNRGFEGLAFRPDPTQPGGGIFYLAHQRAPALLVSVAFDPLHESGTIGASAVLARSTAGDFDDLTGITHEPALGRLFAIAESKDRLVMLGNHGDAEAEIVLPGVQQEGLTFDSAGNLWIADDRAGLLVFRGARSSIAAGVHPTKRF